MAASRELIVIFLVVAGLLVLGLGGQTHVEETPIVRRELMTTQETVYAKLTGQQVGSTQGGAGDPNAFGFLNATIHRDSNGPVRVEYKFVLNGLSREAPPRKISAYGGKRGENGKFLLDLPFAIDARSPAKSLTCQGSLEKDESERHVSLRDTLKSIFAAPGNHYVTVSTAQYAGGAIRGQLGRAFGQD